MSGFLLLFSIGAIAVVLFWYVFDEAVRWGDGTSGILGMGVDQRPTEDATGPNWRSKGKRGWRYRS